MDKIKKSGNVQLYIANVLKFGVWISLFLAFVGGCINLYSNYEKSINFKHFVQDKNSILEIVKEIFSGIYRFDGEAIIYLGVIFLFLTPLSMLIISLVSFIRHRELKFSILTFLIILIISISIYIGLH